MIIIIMIEPIFDPNYINLEYIFGKILGLLRVIYNFILSDLSTIIFLTAAVVFIIITIFFWFRVRGIIKEGKKKDQEVIAAEPISTPKKNERWEEVLRHFRSENSSDWRLAIIEADTILDYMMQSLGYQGKNLGERLKQVDRSNFSTIDSAWEAHKVRNRIAHEGISFKLTKEQARRVIGQYESVFREFGYI